MDDKNSIDHTQCIWRIGRKVERTVYAQIGKMPGDNDTLIGLFDTKDLAKAAVSAHNLVLTGKEIY
jgi:hypothetical protein